MNTLNFKYLVIEDDTNVWENIERRMNAFENWRPIGFCSEIDDTLTKISENKPHLIFSDWSIKGGNAFEILNFIKSIENYQPYVIFFTGYQSEHPEIPQEILNNYPIVKKYLIKPIYENLTNNLADYVIEAEILHKNTICKSVFIENEYKQKIKICPHQCIAFLQNENNPRIKTIYVKDESPINIKYTWEQILDFAHLHQLEYFITHNRKSIVNKSYITKIDKPFVWLENDLKIMVSREKWRELKSGH